MTEDQIKEFKETEKEAEESYDLRDLADEIVDAGDKEWAKKIYMKVEEKAEDSYDLQSLAEYVRQNLGNEKWAKLIDQKAKELEDDN